MRKVDKSEPMIRRNYEFSGGIRGKYVERLKEGLNVVVLDDDVAKEFATDEQVNSVLRTELERRTGQGSSSSQTRIKDETRALTPIERDVLMLLSSSAEVTEIAGRLKLDQQTVRAYIAEILRKTNTKVGP